MNTLARQSCCLALSSALLICCGLVQAQTYQWKDASGKTIISDTPPPSNVQKKRSVGVQQPKLTTGSPASETDENNTEKEVSPAAQPSTPATMAEKDLEFRKRQQEAKEKADKQAKEQAAEAEKRDNCERAKRNLAALENNQPMVTLDENGQRKVMDTTQREQEMERARRFMAESCK